MFRTLTNELQGVVGGQGSEVLDLLAQQCRRAQLCLKYSESTGIADGGDEFRAGEVRPHRRHDDGSLNPKSLAKTCC